MFDRNKPYNELPFLPPSIDLENNQEIYYLT